MSQFQLFDAVKLNESIPLSEGGTVEANTPGAVVEVLNQGEAYMVELFGSWVKVAPDGGLLQANPNEAGAFMETVGVETVFSQQLRLVKPAQETVGARAKLLATLETLPETLLAEVQDFAEFLQYKQRRS